MSIFHRMRIRVQIKIEYDAPTLKLHCDFKTIDGTFNIPHCFIVYHAEFACDLD